MKSKRSEFYFQGEIDLLENLDIVDMTLLVGGSRGGTRDGSRDGRRRRGARVWLVCPLLCSPCVCQRERAREGGGAERKRKREREREREKKMEKEVVFWCFGEREKK